MELIGFAKAGMAEIEKARREIGVKIDKCDKGSATFTVTLNQVEKILYHILSITQHRPLPSPQIEIDLGSPHPPPVAGSFLFPAF